MMLPFSVASQSVINVSCHVYIQGYGTEMDVLLEVSSVRHCHLSVNLQYSTERTGRQQVVHRHKVRSSNSGDS